MRVALVFCLIAQGAAAQTLETHIRFPAGQDWPGGLSGLLMAEDGRSFLAVSDDGQLLEVSITRDRTGRIAGFGTPMIRPLLPPDGADWPDTWLYRDAEGLARMGGGGIAVAFEGLHRITHHDADGTFRRWYQPPAHMMETFYVNQGFEALAMMADGRMIAIPESWPPDPTGVPIMAIEPESRDWSEIAWLPLSDGYAPTGLDRAGAQYYLLERRFHWMWGFTSRIRRFEINDGAVTGLTTLLQTSLNQFGNLEALSLWRRGSDLMVTALSDNNGTRLLPSEIVEWTLSEEQ